MREIVLLALLTLVGCNVVRVTDKTNRCSPKVIIIYPPTTRQMASYECPQGTYVRMERAGDGEKLRSVVVCDCPHEEPAGSDMVIKLPALDAGARWR